MSERLRNQSENFVRKATVLVGEVIRVAPIMAGTGYFASEAIKSASNGKFGKAGFEGYLACIFLSAELILRKGERERAVDFGFQAGAELVMEQLKSRGQMGAVEISIKAPPEGEPFYRSLDGGLEIHNPMELMQRIGSKEGAAVRIGTILQHADKRALNEKEIEYLRLVQAGLNMLPQVKETFCETGGEVFDRMDSLVSEYEKKRKGSQEQ